MALGCDGRDSILGTNAGAQICRQPQLGYMCDRIHFPEAFLSPSMKSCPPQPGSAPLPAPLQGIGTTLGVGTTLPPCGEWRAPPHPTPSWLQCPPVTSLLRALQGGGEGPLFWAHSGSPCSNTAEGLQAGLPPAPQSAALTSPWHFTLPCGCACSCCWGRVSTHVSPVNSYSGKRWK